MNHIKNIIKKINSLMKRYGILYAIIFLIKKLIYKISIYFFSIIISFFILILFYFKKIILIKLFSERIGHYALNTELLLCTLDENRGDNVLYLYYTCDSSAPICNMQLDKMWRKIMPIVLFPSIAYRADRILAYLLRDSYSKNLVKILFEVNSGDVDVDGLLNINKPHLIFNNKDCIFGESQLVKLGIPNGEKYVCFIIRDEAYLKKQFSNADWSYHNYRNSEINSYHKAALFLAEKGYYVVRMGKHVKDAFNISHPRIIDYATSSFSSDFMDIYILSRCYFYVSTSTGLDAVPQIFRRPGAFTNIVLPAELPTWLPCLLFIPKKLKENITHEILTFDEVYRVFDKHNKINSWTLRQESLEVIENTADDILELVQEMEARLRGVWQETEDEKQMQCLFWNGFPNNLTSESGTRRFAKNIGIKIGSKYLRRNVNLLNSGLNDVPSKIQNS